MHQRSIVLEENKPSVEKIFLILVIIFGIVTLIVQPLFSVPDEGTHFANAYQLFHEDSKNENFDRYRFAQDIELYRNNQFLSYYYADKGDFNDNPFIFNLNINQIQYLPQAIGMLIGQMIYPSLGIILTFGRVFNMIFYILIIYFSIKKAKFGKLAMAAIALLPISIQQSISVSYDVMFYCSVFATFSLITNLVTRNKKLDFKWYIYSIAIIVLSGIAKKPSLAMALYFVSLPTLLIGKNWLAKIIDKVWLFINKHKILSFLFFSLLFCVYLSFRFRDLGGLSRGLQVLFNSFNRSDIKIDLDSVFSGMIGNFGWLTHRFPAWLVTLNFIFLTFLMLAEKNIKIQKRLVFTSIIIFLGNVIMVTLTMFISWTIGYLGENDLLYSVGEQGRYYTPFLVVLIPVVIYFKKFITFEVSEKHLRKIFVWFITLNFTYFIMLTLLFYYTKNGGEDFIIQFFTWVRGLL